MPPLNLFFPHRPARQRGPLRRLLARLGPTWVAAPWRRLVQAVCLITFGWLLFYVAWPYTATPARQWTGWLPVDVDLTSGRATLAADPPQTPPSAGSSVFVSALSEGQNVAFGRFSVVKATPSEAVIEPARPLDAADIDRLSASFGPWTLGERDPTAWPSHYIDDLTRKELVPAESLLAIDPLVSLSTAVASRSWVWSLGFAAVILLVCLLIPRGFCAYVCPLGTTIDLADAALSPVRRRCRCNPSETADATDGRGTWVHIKYGTLGAVLAAAVGGVVLSGFLAAIPLFTRAMIFIVRPVATGLERGWHQVPPMSPGQWFSIGLFVIVLGLGFIRPRFWCKFVCPTGAVFSLVNLVRLTQRKVRSTCIACGKCTEICPFDAVKPDFSTRVRDCTFCQECGGACPVSAIQFVARWQSMDEAASTPATAAPAVPSNGSRRAFLGTAAGFGLGALGGLGGAIGIRVARGQGVPPIRPPGSLPEPLFLQTCVRCGECLQACPNDALQPMGLEAGFDALWTPRVAADWSGCEPSCSNCGQVCPTGAIRALPLEEKRVARIGLAVINQRTCLPYAGIEPCQLCADECTTAGYRAVEFTLVGTELDEQGQPVEGSGFLAPVVIPERCVGCGLCQTRCLAVNGKQKRLLDASAIVVEAGEGKEDRLVNRSFLELREAEAEQRKQRAVDLAPGSYLPDFLK